MFITLEGEANVANLVVWAKVFEANRRTVLGASMMGVRGQVRRWGDVIHLIAHRLDDLSSRLARRPQFCSIRRVVSKPERPAGGR